MTKRERVRYEAFLRVQDFWTAHRELFPESTAGAQAFAKVAEAIAQIDALAMNRTLAASDGRRAKAVARAAVRKAMRVIARTAKGFAPDLAGDGNALVIPRQKSDVALLGAARRFIREGEAVKSGLVHLGMPATCLSDLREAADAFEQAMKERRLGRSGVASSQAGIAAALKLGSAALRTLDIVVPNTIENDPALFAGWIRDRRLVEGEPRDAGEVQAAPVTGSGAAEPPGDSLPKAS